MSSDISHSLSDEELMLLSNLSYIPFEDEPFGGLGYKFKTNNATIQDIISSINVNDLRTQYADKEYSGMITGSEWADIITAISQDKALCDLRITNYYSDSKSGDMFTVVDATPEEIAAKTYDNPYVVFKGTGKDEWVDNFEGGLETDSIQQQAALKYIDTINSDNITVVGHSKGGNKAKYVTILSPKVTRCVSLDGQGFSNEFLAKYIEEIKKKGSCITNYALSKDYVNILLNDVGDKIYVEPNNVDSFAQYHCPNAFFDFSKGVFPKINETQQDSALKALHQFTVYIINIEDDSDKRKMLSLLGKLTDYLLGDSNYSVDNIEEFLNETDAENLGILLAYMNEYNNFTNGEFNKSISSVLDEVGSDSGMPISLVCLIVKYFLRNMNENFLAEEEDDFMMQLLNSDLASLGLIITNSSDLYFKISAFYIDTKNFARKKVPTITSKENQNQEKSYDELAAYHEYTIYIKSELIDILSDTGDIAFPDVSSWSFKYSTSDWFQELNIQPNISKIKEYYDEMQDALDKCTQTIKNNYDSIQEATESFDSTLEEKVTSLEQSMRLLVYYDN